MKLDETAENKVPGAGVKGGRDGLFLEKPDIIDKFCRRDINDKDPGLAVMCTVQFGKMFQPYRRKKYDDDTEEDNIKLEDEDEDRVEDDNENENDPSKFIITRNPNYKRCKLPNIIKIKDPVPGEVAIWVKRQFPRAARMHKKREDNNPHRFFLSELMLYTGYTDEQQLGCDDEDRYSQLLFNYLII